MDLLTEVPRGLFIDGTFHPGGERAALINPATEEVLCEVDLARSEDIDAAVEAARRAVPAWRSLSAAERGAWLLRLADALAVHRDLLARLEALNVGKPIWECQRIDVPAAIEAARYFGGVVRSMHGAVLPTEGPSLTYTRAEPYGVVVAIVPWNYPLMLALWKIAPAVAAGNCVVLKPSELTPLTALLLGRLLETLQFPSGVINIVPGRGVPAGERLCVHPEVDFVSFTGSTATGQRVGSLAAAHLKPQSLELGGKSAHLVFDDVDPVHAARIVFNGIFLSQGQMCVAGSRLIVHQRVADALLDELTRRVARLPVGDPLAPDTRVGPQASAAQFAKTLRYVEEAAAAGGRIVTGGGRAPGQERGYYVAPTVVLDPDPDAPVVQDEIFGPVLTVQRFADDDEALALAKRSRYGLAAGIQTHRLERAHEIAAALEVGTVWVNTYGLMSPAVPYGGRRASGYGRELGLEGLYKYTVTKAVWVALR